jgi:hypothetical protein
MYLSPTVPELNVAPFPFTLIFVTASTSPGVYFAGVDLGKRIGPAVIVRDSCGRLI